jgi:hypothetical protein
VTAGLAGAPNRLRHSTGRLSRVPELRWRRGSAGTARLRDERAALPKSELVIVGGAGHLVQLEEPDVINDALVRLVERSTPSKLVAITRRLRDRTQPGGCAG